MRFLAIPAGYVHAVRRNPAGIAKNLTGARLHLARSGAAAAAWGVDVPTLLAGVDARLADPTLAATPPAIRRIPPA